MEKNTKIIVGVGLTLVVSVGIYYGFIHKYQDGLTGFQKAFNSPIKGNLSATGTNVTRKRAGSLNQISCSPGCTLSTNTKGASSTVTVGNTTYTCRCSDGSTSDPIINKNS